MHCAEYALQVGDFVDGTLDAPAQQALESHLAGCPACRRTVDDFRAIRAAAATLEQHVPAPQIWNRIAAAVDADRQRPWWQRGPLRGLGLQQLAAATVAGILVAGVGWMAWRDLGPITAGAPTTMTVDTATDPNAEAIEPGEVVRRTEDLYVREITGLEQITTPGITGLDAGTADVLQASFTVLDQAIVDSRAALVTEPENEVAQESLFEALRSKVELLQDAIALINEMRQGNQEGAARIVSGQNP